MSLGDRLLRAAFGLWLLFTAALVWVLLIVPHEDPGGADRDYPVEVANDASYEDLAAMMVREKMIRHPRAWAFYMRMVSDGHTLRRGHWVLNRARTQAFLLPRFVRGRGQASVNMLIPEGFTQFDVATRAERFGLTSRAALLAALRDPSLLEELAIPGPSAEGYLFPATYSLLQDQDPGAIVRRLVLTFRKRTKSLFEADRKAREAAGLPARADHEVITLASVVEREARLPEEQPIIAGVFHNRLVDPTFRPHRLQSDPTAAYGCLLLPELAPTCRDFDGKRITAAMLRDPANPYNTYRHDGLPPGPIANPGLSALKAALSPAQHGYFYFVAKGGGRHAFAATLEEHNLNIHGPR